MGGGARAAEFGSAGHGAPRPHTSSFNSGGYGTTLGGSAIPSARQGPTGSITPGGQAWGSNFVPGREGGAPPHSASAFPSGAAPTVSGGATVNNMPATYNDAYMSDNEGEADSALRGVAV